MFKKKDKTVSEIKDPNEKFSRTVVQETVETSGGVQTTRTVITTANKDEIETALKKFNLDTGTRSGTASVTKKVVYSSSGKQVTEETVESFDTDMQSCIDTRFLEQLQTSTKTDQSQPAKNDTTPSKNGKTFTERLGLKSSKTSQPKTSDSADSKTKAKSASCVSTGKFEDDALKSHNSYRSKHGVPPLKLSKELCAYSKEWADHLAATDKFQHRTEKKYGENIFMKWSSDPTHVVTGNEAVDSWYSEIKDHVFGREPTSMKSGHFTQVIWKKSTHLGIAWSRSKSGKVLVVANYDPPGNFVGTFTENVPPPKK